MLIEWIGETRIVPTLGEVSKGSIRRCMDKLGQSLIKQKLAKEHKVKAINTKDKED
jgi:hypothetical protein